jgi:hypothetical protein
VVAGNLVLPPVVSGVVTIAAPAAEDGIGFGAIDGAIREVAGDQYHRILRDQAQAHHNRLPDCTTVFVPGNKANHDGGFDNVIFVIDELHAPLSQVMVAVLTEAHQHQVPNLFLPVMRAGFNKGYGPEKTADEIAHKMWEGMRTFVQSNPDFVTPLTIVVYQNPALIEVLTRVAVQMFGAA